MRYMILSIAAAHYMIGGSFYANAKANEGAKAADPLPPASGPETPAPVAPLAPVEGAPLASTEAPASETVETASAKAKADRVKPVLTGIASGIVMPERTASVSGVGGQKIYPFDDLVTVGDSFGVKNKTANQIASTITGANKRNKVQATNEDGTPKFTAATDIKGPDGAIVGQTKPVPVMVSGKTFKAYDVDPKTDPDGASVRVWRTN